MPTEKASNDERKKFACNLKKTSMFGFPKDLTPSEQVSQKSDFL